LPAPSPGKAVRRATRTTWLEGGGHELSGRTTAGRASTSPARGSPGLYCTTCGQPARAFPAPPALLRVLAPRRAKLDRAHSDAGGNSTCSGRMSNLESRTLLGGHAGTRRGGSGDSSWPRLRPGRIGTVPTVPRPYRSREPLPSPDGNSLGRWTAELPRQDSNLRPA